MKTFPRLLLAALLLLAPLTFTACQSPERAALNAVKVQIVTVDQAMQAFVDYEKIHGMDAPTRLRVKKLHADYVAANLATERAWLAYHTALEAAAPDAPALQKHWDAARALLSASQADLLTFIQRLVSR